MFLAEIKGAQPNFRKGGEQGVAYHHPERSEERDKKKKRESLKQKGTPSLLSRKRRHGATDRQLVNLAV